MTGERAVSGTVHEEVNSHGSRTRPSGSTLTGLAGLVRSSSTREVVLIVAAWTSSEVGARIAPVVEKPSRARKPAAAGLGQVPSAARDESASVQAASGGQAPWVA